MRKVITLVELFVSNYHGDDEDFSQWSLKYPKSHEGFFVWFDTLYYLISMTEGYKTVPFFEHAPSHFFALKNLEGVENFPMFDSKAN